MKTKIRRLAVTLLAVLLAAALALTLAACGGESGTEPDGGEEGASDSYIVTFHYGFYEADYDYDTHTVPEDKYLYSYDMTSRNGNKVTVSTVLTRQFEVEGFEVSGYSTDAWSQDGIASDMDVYVLYEPKESATVSFYNYDGSLIKTVQSYVGDAVSGSVMPDTSDVIVLYSETERPSSIECVSYDSGYIAKEDESRLGDAVIVPFGYYFDSWDGTISSVSSGENKITAVVKEADGVVLLTESASASNSIDAVWSDKKAAFYGDKVYDLQHSVKLSMRTGSAMSDTDVLSDSDWTDISTVTISGESVSSGSIDAQIYMRWDKDLIYFFVQVTDPFVVTNGKDFVDGVPNGWYEDGVEMWLEMGDGVYFKIFIDAYGYYCKTSYGAQGTPSAYIDYTRDNNLYATTIYDASGNTMDKDSSATYTSSKGQKVTLAAGYNVEFAIPAYMQPEDDGATVSETLGGENWGQKLTSGSKMYVTLQLDNTSWYCPDDFIEESIIMNDTQFTQTFIENTLTSTERGKIDFVAYGGYMINNSTRNNYGQITVLG